MNSWTGLKIVLIAWLFCLVDFHHADAQVSEDDALVTAIHQEALSGFEKQGLVGLAVKVTRNGQEITTITLGDQDRENEVPVSSETMFRWASISKPVTAIAAMLLVEEGKLDLDADIRTYVPEFPEKDQIITARQLMCHQGGIVHYRNGPVIRSETEYDIDHPFESVILALDTFKESPLVSAPGESYNYTTHGYILLSAVVERAAGQPFAEFVDERIATPLGMDSFQPDYQWVEISNRAVGYRKLLNRVVASGNSDVSWKLGGGGFISSIDDLSAFAEGMAARSLLTPESFEVIWQSQTPANGRDPGYGLGFGVNRSGDELVISHSGAQQKTRTIMIVLPDSGTTIVAMTNSEYANPGEITAGIRKLMQASNSSTNGG